MKVSKFICLDQSLTNTGVSIWVNGKIETMEIKPKNTSRGCERLHYIKGMIGKLIWDIKPDFITLEDLAYGSHAGMVFDLGGIYWIIKLECWENDVPTISIPIGTIKKYVTGNGAAKKSEMMLQVYKKWGLETKNDNIADSFGVCKLMESYLQWKEGKEGFTKKEIECLEMISKIWKETIKER